VCHQGSCPDGGKATGEIRWLLPFIDRIDRMNRINENCGRGLLTLIIDIRRCLSQLKPPADSKSAGGYDSTEIK